MKQYKWFAISENSSDLYYTKKDALKDLKNFGDEVVYLYSLKKIEDKEKFRKELTSEDLFGVYILGKKNK